MDIQTIGIEDASQKRATSRILFVEDDGELGPLVLRVLQEQGYKVQWVSSAEDALLLSSAFQPNLIITDRMLPGMDGLELCETLRKQGGNAPILMLTALGADTNMIEGLDAGADDYIGKPFSYQVLLAKVRAMLRRFALAGTLDTEQLRVADLVLQPSDRSVMRAGQLIRLTAKEFHLLYYLIRHKGMVKTKEEILEAVWGIDFDPGTNVVEVYLNYLRNKIDKPYDQKLIHTHIGLGYSLREEV